MMHLWPEGGFGAVWLGLKWTAIHIVVHSKGKPGFMQWREEGRFVEKYTCRCGDVMVLH